MKHHPLAHKKTTLAREAIESLLFKVARPMTSYEISRHPDLADVDIEPTRVSGVIREALRRKKNSLRIGTMPGYDRGRSKFLYYHLDAFDPNVAFPSSKRVAPPVNTVNPEVKEFVFNPVDFEGERVAPAEPEQPHVVRTAKQVTIEVNGVTIRIDLEH